MLIFSKFSFNLFYILCLTVVYCKNNHFICYEGNEWKNIESRSSYNETTIKRNNLLIFEELLDFNDINTEKYYVDIGTSNFHATPSNGFDWDLKYKGVCVEPNLDLMSNILKHRSCRGVVNPISDRMNEEVYVKSGDHSTNSIIDQLDIKDQTKDQLKSSNVRKVSTVTLDAMLTYLGAPKVIDMLIIHCSSKLKIIQQLHTSQYRFTTIFLYKPDREIHKELVNLGYWFFNKYTSVGRCIYIHYTIKHFELLMDIRKKYEMNEYYTNWQKLPHLYLTQPAWEKDLKYLKTYKTITTTTTEINE